MLHECTNIKNLRIQILNLNDNSVEYDTLYNFASSPTTDSLITLSKVHSIAGNKEIAVVATMSDFTTKGTSLRFTVIQRPFVNKAPEISVSGMKSITNIQTCSLTVKVNDDIGQKSSVVVKYHNVDYFLDLNGKFVVIPEPGFVGTDSVVIIATDNYTPPLSSIETVFLSVTAPDLLVPQAPVNVKIATQTTSITTLVWDKSLTAIDYAIYRSTIADKDFKNSKILLSIVNFPIRPRILSGITMLLHGMQQVCQQDRKLFHQSGPIVLQNGIPKRFLRKLPKDLFTNWNFMTVAGMQMGIHLILLSIPGTVL